MVNNFLCETCSKNAICNRFDKIAKFSEEAKKPLGITITMDSCSNYENDTEEKEV